MTDTARTAFPDDDGAKRPVWPAIGRGLKKKCPRCGEGAVLRGYLKVRDECEVCGQDFTGHRADDAPPYVTMLIVGHVLIVPIVEVALRTDIRPDIQMLVWLIVALSMTLWLLPISKGGLIGLQWANRMHGFGGEDDEGEDPEASLRA